MKKILLLLPGCLLFVAATFVDPPGNLVGRWQKRFPNGMIAGAVFRPDSSYDGSVNGKMFVTGNYYVRQDTLALADGGCGLAYYGTYKLKFFAADSVRVTVIQDTCRGRRRGTDGLTMGRVKSTKP